MEERIDQEIFDHLVQLAALELEPPEAQYLRQQLNNQLKAIDELEAVQLDEGTPPTYHGVPYTPDITPPGRVDEWIACPNPGQILAQAPELDDGYVVVPEIPHTDLEP